MNQPGNTEPLASIVSRVWHSPTLMTWGNLGTRLLGFLVLLPLALGRLTVEEANLWFLFQALLALQRMADFGFTPTFVRIVSYARAGEITAETGLVVPGSLKASETSMRRVIRTMRKIYNRLSLIAFVLVAVGGSLAVIKPISQLDTMEVGWLAWATVAVSGVLIFRWGVFGVYLQGAEQIALHQRWQIVTGMLSIIAAIAVLYFGGGLFLLVAAMQAGSIAGVLVTRRLAIKYSPNDSWSEPPVADAEVMNAVWPAAWRSGLGITMTYGIIQGIGIGYAQIASPAQSAAFLLAQRVVRTLNSFANAPFYTRLPHMSRLYAEGRRHELVESARAGMLRANWVLVAGIVTLGFTADPLFVLVGSQTPFVTMDVWWLLGLATLVERIGAMHLQLYSTTNNIVWHFVATVTGGLMLLVIPLSFHWFGVVGLPLGILVAYAGFFTPYSLKHSYSTFHLRFVHMDGLASMLPVTVVAAVLIVFMLISA